MEVKAIIEAPDSCVVCPLGHGNPVGTGVVCKAVKPSVIYKDAFHNQRCRPVSCPLIVSKEKAESELGEPLRWVFKTVIDTEYGDNIIFKVCPKCSFGYRGSQVYTYCPSCGVRLLPPKDKQ